MKPIEIAIEGRHDPVIVPRAIPIVESALAIVIADLSIQRGIIPPVLEKRD